MADIEQFIFTIKGQLDDAELKAKMAEVDAKIKQYESTGVHVALYMDLQQAGLPEGDIKGAFKGLNLPVSDFNNAQTATRELETSLGGAATAAANMGSRVKDSMAATAGATKNTEEAFTSLGRAQEQVGSSSGRIGLPAANSLSELRGELKLARDEFDGSPASVNRLKGAYDNYNTVLTKSKEVTGESASAYNSLGSLIERQAMRIGVGLAIWTTLRTVQQYIQETIAAMQQYDTEVARFASITEQSIGEAEQQYRNLREIAAQGGFTPQQAAPGIQQAARFQKTAQGQEELYSAATGLSEAIGLKDTTKATEILGSAMLNTGKSAKELADLVYTGFKNVGGAPDEFLSGLKNIQALTDETGTEFTTMFGVIARATGASGRSMDTVSQSMTRFANTINNIPANKISEFEAQIKGLSGVEILNPDSTIKTVDEILSGIGQKWDTFSPDIQAKIVDALGGGKLRGQIKASGLAIMDSWGDGALEGAQGAVDKVNAVINKSLGQMQAQITANIEGMKSEGNPLGLIGQIGSAIDVAGGWLTGGREGAKRAARREEITTSVTSGGGAQTKEAFVKSLTGMTPNEAAAAIDEYNKIVKDSLGAAPEDIRAGLVSDTEKQKVISGMSETGAAAGESFGASFAKAVGGFTDSVLVALGKAAPGLKIPGAAAGRAATAEVTQPISAPSARQGNTEYARNISAIVANASGTQADIDKQISDALQVGNAIDLMKYSVDQVNTAKQQSIILEQQYLDQVRQSLQAQGLMPAVIDQAIAALQRQANAQTDVLRTQSGMLRMGQQQSKFFQQSLQDQQAESQKKKSEESNFVFQRHKEISPEQFPQLQALTQMYDSMLTRMGSPEKEKNINLLLGDNNTFKTMTGRLTALQMAMEDLTKVEKAQLSGTWNMPAGATALVPISSLDLQRWNKPEGGGMSADALRALMNATGQSGEQVSTSMQTAATRIIDAIKERATQAGLPMDKISKATTIPEAVNLTREALLHEVALGQGKVEQAFRVMQQPLSGKEETPREAWRAPAIRERGFSMERFLIPQGASAAPASAALTGARAHGEIQAAGNKPLPVNVLSLPESPVSQGQKISPELSSTLNTITQMIVSAAARAPRGGGRGLALGGGGGTDDDGMRISDLAKQAPAQVQVSALPIKANFNASISVVLNGAIVARALMPIMYQMLSKLTASTGTRPKGTMR
jgi:hypothetical protein